MRFSKVDETKYMINPEGMPIKDLLLAIAEVSYDTALPRGLGKLQAYEAPGIEACLEKCIEYEDGDPVRLVVDYVHGRDCRTLVYLGEDNNWYLHAYSFQQRKVTSEEFYSGIIRDPADKFLEAVAERIQQRRSN